MRKLSEQKTESNEPFYTESWYIEDILDVAEILDVSLTESQLNTAKEMISALFDDKSYRNEQIVGIVSTICKGR